MSHVHAPTTVTSPRRLLAGTGLLALPLLLGGCSVDSFMDPSVVGRWEHTPTVVPIIERIAAIETGDDSYVEIDDVAPEDLIPDAAEYRLAAGDSVDIQIRDFYRVGIEEPFRRTVSSRGLIELPRLASIRASGLTREELQEAIRDAVRDARIKENAVVTVQVSGQRQQTFHALGNVRSPGTYFVPEPDYRLLEALTAAGGFAESVPVIYVIRQIPLSASVTGEPEFDPASVRDDPIRTIEPSDPERLFDLIDDLSDGDEAPGVFGFSAFQPDSRQPAIDLIESDTVSPEEAAARLNIPSQDGWMFLNGRWVRVTGRGASDEVGEAREIVGDADELAALVTQRVIAIPTEPLLMGAAEYNIVIRAGDLIRVPTPSTGLVYVTGQIARPGSFRLPDSGRLTLLRAIDSAGGLSSLAIPERVDLTRMVGPNKQATIRLNLRAIASQVQPDLFLKADDRINIGTNFFAFPLAVFRGGLRASYGFGFLLDRNFGADVFGAPPSNVGR